MGSLRPPTLCGHALLGGRGGAGADAIRETRVARRDPCNNILERLLYLSGDGVKYR